MVLKEAGKDPCCAQAICQQEAGDDCELATFIFSEAFQEHKDLLQTVLECFLQVLVATNQLVEHLKTTRLDNHKQNVCHT